MSEDRFASYLEKLDGPVAPDAGFADSLLEDLLDELGSASPPSAGRRVASRVIPRGGTRARVLSRVVAAAAIIVVFATSIVVLGRSISHRPASDLISAATISRVKPAWTIQTEDPILAPPTVSNGIVYEAGEQNVYAIDARSGQPVWTVRRDAHTTGADESSPELIRNMVVMGSGNYDGPDAGPWHHGTVFGIDASTGHVLWRRALPGAAVTVAAGQTPGALAFAVTLGAPKRLAPYATGAGRVFALDPLSGATVWSNRVPSTTIPPILDRGQLLVTSSDGIRAFDSATGSLLWHASIDRPSGPVIGRTAIYFNAADGAIHALVRATGRPLWKVSARFGTRSYLGWGGPGVDGDTVFALGPDLRLAALDAYDGHVLWTGPRLPVFELGNPPGVDAESGVLFLPASSGGLLALDPSNGKVVWSMSGNASPSVTVSGSAIYVTAVDGSVGAFRLPS
jgi:outer membrane protein assembly factor BamB